MRRILAQTVSKSVVPLPRYSNFSKRNFIIQQSDFFDDLCGLIFQGINMQKSSSCGFEILSEFRKVMGNLPRDLRQVLDYSLKNSENETFAIGKASELTEKLLDLFHHMR